MTHPYDQHVAQQVKLNKRKSRLMIFVFVAIMHLNLLFFGWMVIFDVPTSWLTLTGATVIGITNGLSIYWLWMGGRWISKEFERRLLYKRLDKLKKTVVRSVMLECHRCCIQRAFSGAADNGIEQEAKVKAQMKASKQGWVFLEDRVLCPKCGERIEK
jgi:hypothetical protein